MTTFRMPALCGALLALAPAAAAGADACGEDARRLCPDVPIGEGRVVNCLREHWNDLSSSCQHTIQGVDNRARQVSVACTWDVYQYCQSVPTGGGRVLSCLSRRWDDLTSTCKDAVGQVAEKGKQFASACKADAERLCQGIEPGGGRIFACLKLQERAVSSRCADAMRP